MSLVLAYAGRLPAEPRYRVPPGLFPVLLVFSHINLCWQLSKPMIIAVCCAKQFNFSIWAPAAWIPGTYLARSDYILGLALMILPSILAGVLLWDVIVRYRDGIQPVFGRGAWRFLLLIFLWLCWIPIPAPYTVPFLFSQWAANITG